MTLIIEDFQDDLYRYNFVKLPGEGFRATQFAPDGRLVQLLWLGEDLVYRVREASGQWTHERIAGDLLPGDAYSEQSAFAEAFRDHEQAQLVFDSTGTPHVLTFSENGRIAHYRRGNTWEQIETLDPSSIHPGTSAFFDALVAAPGADGSLHLVLHESQFDFGKPDVHQLVYGTNTSGRWVFQPITTTGRPRSFFRQAYAPRYLSLAVDSANNAHLAFTKDFVNATNPDGTGRPLSKLSYATNAGGAWTTAVVDEPADDSADAGLGASIAIGPGNQVAIANFFNDRQPTGSPSFSELRYYIRQSNGAFSRERVSDAPDGYFGTDGPRFTGFSPHLVFDFQGRPNIVFADHAAQHFDQTGADEFGGQIRHAVRGDAGWSTQTIFRQTDPVMNQLVYPSLALSAGEAVYTGLRRQDEVGQNGQILGTKYQFVMLSRRSDTLAALSGLVDFDDQIIAGKPLAGAERVTLVNSHGIVGETALRAVDPISGVGQDLFAADAGFFEWTQANDQTFLGNVDGVGVDEVIQVNRSPMSGGPAPQDLYRILTAAGVETARVATSLLGDRLSGMTDPEDFFAVGHFTPQRRADGSLVETNGKVTPTPHLELLLFNRTANDTRVGAQSFVVIDLTTGTIVDNGVYNAEGFAGWIDATDEAVVSDTDFDGMDDVVIINRVANPDEFRATNKGFVGMVSFNPRNSGRQAISNDPNSLGSLIGFYRFFDWNFAKSGEASVFPGYDDLADQATFGSVQNNGQATPVITLINSQTDGNPLSAAYALLQPAPLVQGVRDSFQLISTQFRSTVPPSFFDPEDLFLMADVNNDGSDEFVSLSRVGGAPAIKAFAPFSGLALESTSTDDLIADIAQARRRRWVSLTDVGRESSSEILAMG